MFREAPNLRAIILIGNPSARYDLRISARSSTDNTGVHHTVQHARLDPAAPDSASTAAMVVPTDAVTGEHAIVRTKRRSP